MRARRPASLVLAALVAAPWLADAAQAEGKPIEAASRVDAVTVYADRAMVRRVTRVEHGAGLSRVRFPRLARDLMADSVRVGGDGTGGETIHGFDLRTSFLGESPKKDVAALEARLQQLGDRDRTLSDERNVHQRQLDTLIETAEKSAGGLAAQLAAGKANMKTWQELLGYLKT